MAGSEIRAIARVEENPLDLRVTLWDETTLTGTLAEPVVTLQTALGPIPLPAAQIASYTQPLPSPPPISTARVPYRSARMPAIGWPTPQRMFCRPMATENTSRPAAARVEGEHVGDHRLLLGRHDPAHGGTLTTFARSGVGEHVCSSPMSWDGAIHGRIALPADRREAWLATKLDWASVEGHAIWDAQIDQDTVAEVLDELPFTDDMQFLELEWQGDELRVASFQSKCSSKLAEGDAGLRSFDGEIAAYLQEVRRYFDD
ncbi:MAG: hypothetical protein HC927_02480 [Deltaproteobacteria bacterium]|nr:hypothetical protein [Deltaproteobacteria bacterium]